MTYAARWRAVIAAVDPAVAAAARARIDALTKPRRSLGRLEDLAVRLCALAGGTPAHAFERRAVLVAAADHGVAADGVSAYPPEVTAQMVGGFLAGSAAIGALARAVDAQLYVADFGVRTPAPAHERLIDARCGAGTANLAREPAIAAAAVEGVLDAGVAVFAELRRRTAFDVLALGEMGIGNTTAAAAMVAAFTGSGAELTVGRGTGIDDARLARKTAAVASALARIGAPAADAEPAQTGAPAAAEPAWKRIASEAGGFEIVGLAGVILAAAEARVAIVLDGYIVAAAALLAAAIAPAALGYCVAGHRSREPGHALALERLGLVPLLDLDLALGEASGAALALPLLSAAARMVREMKTFAEAGVAAEAAG